MQSRSNARLMGFVAALAVFLAAVGLAVFSRSNAQADPAPATGTNNAQVTISDIKVVKSSVTGQEQSGTVYKDNTVKISWNWNAASARPEKGQTFYLALPENPLLYSFYDTAPFDLKINDADKTVVAVCTPTRNADQSNSRIICEFNDGLTKAVQNGNVQLTGSGWFIATAQDSKGTTSGTFDANGVKTVVPTPGNQPIGPAPYNFANFNVSKTNWGVTSTTTQITWNILFSGTTLKDYYNGQIPEVIELRDSLGGAHLFDDKVALLVTASQADGDFTDICVAAQGGLCSPVNDPRFGQFNVEYVKAADGRSATFRITGKDGAKFLENTNYRLMYRSKPTTGGAIDQEAIYSNEASLVGSDKPLQMQTRTAYVATAGGDAQMEPGYGTFQIGKQVNGNAKGEFPQNATVRFKVDWTLPDGKKPADFQQWQAPENPFYFEVPFDKRTNYLPQANPRMPFPKGTVVTLTEDLTWTSGGALPRGVKFNNPQITGGTPSAAAASTTFTIAALTTLPINVVNEAVYQSVSVGDYVWFDTNADGLQDGSDVPLEGVVLSISRTDGGDVKKVDGTVVTTTTTDAQGMYSFDGLRMLPEGQKYVVTVTPPAGYLPTKVVGAVTDGNNSSTGSETAVELSTDGARDATLDFGFVKAVPGIDIEKYDGDWAGVQFSGDKPVLTNGQPAVLPTGDRDGEGDALVLSGLEAQLVKFTVTNTGTDGLKNVVVTDRPDRGPVLTGLKCHINGSDIAAVSGVVTAPADWVLPPKGSFECTATLPAMTGAAEHANTATVEAIPVAGGEPVKDEDEWHAKRAKVSVGDYVWFDTNADGLQDDSDVPLKDVTLTISRTDGKTVKKVDGSVVDSTKTDAEGKYLFADLEILPAGEKYVVTVTAPDNYEPTKTEQGSDRAKDSSTGSATAVALTQDGDKDLTLDFGFVKKPVGIDIEKYDGNWGGVAFDQDGNPELVDGQPKVLPAGDHDSEADALVLSGLAAQVVKFTVTNTGKGELTKVTVSDQTFKGPALTDLKCTIDGKEIAAVNGVVSAPADWKFAPKGSFECTATLPAMTDAAEHSNTATVKAIPVAGGNEVTDSDKWHAKRAKVSVGDYVWFDANADGLQDTSDMPLKDVTLSISRTDKKQVKKVDGSVVDSTKTDAAGKYLFADLEILPAGVKYVVTVTDPAGYVATKAEQGSDRANDSSTGSETANELTKDGDKDLSLDFGFVKAKVSVGDYVWLDVNKDGLQDDGEKGIQDVTLTISRTDNMQVKKVDGTTVTTTKTDAEGKYLFADLEILPAGEKYVVTVSDPAGYVATKAEQGSDRAKDSSTGSATAVELTQDGAKDLTLDFGFFFPEVSVGDYVWFDANKDGLQDGSDVPLKDVVLAISRSDGKAVNNADHTPRTELTTTTDANGKYAFNGLEVLTGEVKYVVTVTAPFGYVPTKAGMNNGAGSDDSSTNTSASVKDLSTDGASDPTLDFGFIKAKVSVGDYVWFDKDKDGVQDADEPGIEDVTLTLTGPDGKSVTDVDGNPVGPVKTNNEGKYIFENLPVLPKGESYTVTVSDPEGYLPTKAGANNGAGSDDSSTGFSVSVADLSTDGASDPTLDFGFIKAKVSVGDYVFEDVNDNGVQDQGDKPIKDVTLTLTGPDGKSVTDVDGNPVGPVKTNNEGKYIFENLPVLKDGQSYTVTVTPPAGYEPAKTGQGTRETDSSKDKATSIGLTKDGQQDLSLDFGFKKPTPPTPPATPPATPKGGKLAKTGANAQTLTPYALTLLAAGGILLLLRRKKG